MIHRVACLALLAVLAAGAAEGAESAVRSILCDRLPVRHVPAADVAYQPGVDVRGRPVAPAELPSTSPDWTIRAPLTLDLAERAGIPTSRGIDAEGVIGRVVIEGNQVRLDSRLPPPDEAAALAAACRGDVE